jgi:hypothetical protein
MGVEIVTHGRTVIKLGMGDWKKIICLKTKGSSRPMCIRFISSLMQGRKFKTTKINISRLLYEDRIENNLTVYILCCVHSILTWESTFIFIVATLTSHMILAWVGTFILSCRKLFYSPPIHDRVLFYQSSCYSCSQLQSSLAIWRRNFLLILAHPVFKTWIIQEPNKVALWNKRHFEERKTEIMQHV